MEFTSLLSIKDYRPKVNRNTRPLDPYNKRGTAKSESIFKKQDENVNKKTKNESILSKDYIMNLDENDKYAKILKRLEEAKENK